MHDKSNLNVPYTICSTRQFKKLKIWWNYCYVTKNLETFIAFYFLYLYSILKSLLDLVFPDHFNTNVIYSYNTYYYNCRKFFSFLSNRLGYDNITTNHISKHKNAHEPRNQTAPNNDSDPLLSKVIKSITDPIQN